MGTLSNIGSSLGISGMNLMGIVGNIMQLLFLLVLGIGAFFFIKWFLEREKYNAIGEIWVVQHGSTIPFVERNIKGGYFLNPDGTYTFNLLGHRFENAVVKIDSKHIIKDGKKWRFWLRKEGDRYYFSFVPKNWVNKKGKKDFELVTEDGSIVNQAIIKDRQITDRHTDKKDWVKYAELMVPYVMGMVVIIVAYFTYKYLNVAIGEVSSMRAACSAAVKQGSWALGLISAKMFNGKGKNN